MSWFTYTDASSGTFYAPVRREIFFPNIDENLKVGDWIFVSLADINIGKVFSVDGSTIDESFDSDSYLVVYEEAGSNTATYSLIDSNLNLYFKSVTAVSSGAKPVGKYYVYYHADNIQYIELSGSNYLKTTPPGGSNFIGSLTSTGANGVNYYSNEVLGNSSNTRIAAIGYISSTGSWSELTSTNPGDKVVGTFNGPVLKIYGDKNTESGTVKIKIIKTSSSGVGQKVMKEEEVDLYSALALSDTVIYSVDTETYTELEDYEDIYGSFSFEIEVLDKKNLSSTNKKCKISKYAFSKNYNLSIRKEEIKEDISFVSTGVVR
jgi:hypothetical protein